MLKQAYLMIPGPTMVPPRALAAMGMPMINHRGEEFAALCGEVNDGVRQVFQTKNDIVIFPASGTGGMEAAVVNLFSPGDRVLIGTMGVFGERFRDICLAFGLQVEEVAAPWGEAVTAEAIGDRLAADGRHEIKGVLVTHNETSTGVTLDLAAIARARGDHPALLVVDAISGMGAIPLATDEWGVDVVVAGSQKAFMIPPGLALLSVSERAWEAAAAARLPRHYWDLSAYRKLLGKGQTPYTPAVSQWFALREALRLIQEEGLENIYRRHAVLGRMTRAAVKALGLELFAREEWASNSVTAVRVPPGVDGSALRRTMRTRYGVTIAGGQGKIQKEIFRVGHLGYAGYLDIIACVAALELALAEQGVPVTLGQGVAAAQGALREAQ